MADSDSSGFDLFSGDSGNDSDIYNDRTKVEKKKDLIGGKFPKNSKEYESEDDEKKSEDDDESNADKNKEILQSNYKLIKLDDIEHIEKNTKISYIKKNNKLIVNKYFKDYNILKNEMNVGFSRLGNSLYSKSKYQTIYVLKINDIKELYIHNTASVDGGNKETDPKLKDTIEIKKSDWSNLQPDTVISYKKKDDSMIYYAKFNNYHINKVNGHTQLAVNSATGFNYFVNPGKLKAIYRHVTSKDKTMIQLFTKIKLLEDRIDKLEKLQK